ncbi:MAG TPA: antitoxin [Candidatus Polarisedimenticolia bacterium]|nr:antitoxin [Candidatus Polarisedimenticolia bacterium]
MSRISIDVTEDQHKRLKALAALSGVSLKDYLLKNALDSRKGDEEKALVELENFLDERLRKARAGKISKRKVGDIFKQATCKSTRRPRPNQPDKTLLPARA